ncbi:MAG: pyridoxamine 5'-phosphate oxidase family protein [Planctomycetes bacterium]|nr:pyridoxamine 5'-phosphate oxidase family protein [Planctomycetota bacterium]
MSDVRMKVKEFLASVNKAAVATCNNNAPSCRIMEVQKVEDDLTLWFVTHKNSPKVDHIQKGSEVCIVAHKEHAHMDIRLTGKCEVFTDMETKKSVWNKKLSPFFKVIRIWLFSNLLLKKRNTGTSKQAACILRRKYCNNLQSAATRHIEGRVSRTIIITKIDVSPTFRRMLLPFVSPDILPLKRNVTYCRLG